MSGSTNVQNLLRSNLTLSALLTKNTEDLVNACIKKMYYHLPTSFNPDFVRKRHASPKGEKKGTGRTIAGPDRTKQHQSMAVISHRPKQRAPQQGTGGGQRLVNTVLKTIGNSSRSPLIPPESKFMRTPACKFYGSSQRSSSSLSSSMSYPRGTTARQAAARLRRMRRTHTTQGLTTPGAIYGSMKQNATPEDNADAGNNYDSPKQGTVAQGSADQDVIAQDTNAENIFDQDTIAENSTTQGTITKEAFTQSTIVQNIIPQDTPAHRPVEEASNIAMGNIDKNNITGGNVLGGTMKAITSQRTYKHGHIIKGPTRSGGMPIGGYTQVCNNLGPVARLAQIREPLKEITYRPRPAPKPQDTFEATVGCEIPVPPRTPYSSKQAGASKTHFSRKTGAHKPLVARLCNSGLSASKATASKAAASKGGVSKSCVSKSSVSKSSVSKSSVSKPGVPKPGVSNPGIFKSKASKSAHSKLLATKLTASKSIESKTIASKSFTAKSLTPKTLTFKSIASKSMATKPRASKLYTSKSNVSRLSPSKPTVSRSTTSRSTASRPAVSKSNVYRPDFSKPDVYRPDNYTPSASSQQSSGQNSYTRHMCDRPGPITKVGLQVPLSEYLHHHYVETRPHHPKRLKEYIKHDLLPVDKGTRTRVAWRPSEEPPVPKQIAEKKLHEARNRHIALTNSMYMRNSNELGLASGKLFQQELKLKCGQKTGIFQTERLMKPQLAHKVGCVTKRNLNNAYRVFVEESSPCSLQHIHLSKQRATSQRTSMRKSTPDVPDMRKRFNTSERIMLIKKVRDSRDSAVGDVVKRSIYDNIY